MSPCARGCCWTPMGGVCARNRTCSCHWEERKPRNRNTGGTSHPDPTAAEAIRNVMKAQERRK